MSTPPVTGTGDGTRANQERRRRQHRRRSRVPSTKTAASRFPSRPAPGGNKSAKRTVVATKHDDSAAFELTADLPPARYPEPDDGGRA